MYLFNIWLEEWDFGSGKFPNTIFITLQIDKAQFKTLVDMVALKAFIL